MPSHESETSGSVVAVVMDHENDDEEYDQTARAVLTKEGFDPDDLNKKKKQVRPGRIPWRLTPMNYFCAKGNLPMVRYLVFRRGAACRKTTEIGWFPMIAAAANGHLDIVQFLAQVGGAHEDIRNVTKAGTSPLRIAFKYGQFPVAQWLILNGAWAPHIVWILGRSLHNCSKVIDDTLMRRELRPEDWDIDKPIHILSWARKAVIDHDNIYVFLTGTIVSAASYRRHPKNQYATRSKRMKVAPSSTSSSSPVVLLKGNIVLELVAAYVEKKPKPHELRIYRHLLDRLPTFIENESRKMMTRKTDE